MTEISGDMGPIKKIPTIESNKYKAQPSYMHSDFLRCEECPSAKICKKVGNFRESCEPGHHSVNGHDNMAKCTVTTNILLAHLYEVMKEKV